MTRRGQLRRAPGAPGRLGLSLIVAGLGLAATGTTAAGATAARGSEKPPARPSPAARAAAAVARQGLLRRSDLGSGWSIATAAPANAASLTCGADRSVLAAVASATWSEATGTVFSSGTSYGFAGVAAQRRVWRQTGTAAMGRCLERAFEQGSSHGVVLHATAVRMLAAPRLPPGASRLSIRRYEVSGTATGAGQNSPVTLDVILAGYRTWIGEDEFSVADSAPPLRAEARVAAGQDRRVVR
jgi:hypothetical protein